MKEKRRSELTKKEYWRQKGSMGKNPLAYKISIPINKFINIYIDFTSNPKIASNQSSK